MQHEPVLVLLSGGLDSATVLALADRAGHPCHALSFRYGQRHAIELDCAAALAKEFKVVAHQIIDIDLRAFGGSALTADIEVPKDEDNAGIPITYVPARNTVFLSLALAYAEVHNINRIDIGVNAIDYSGYPDCRPEFISAFENLANLATKRGVEGQRMRIHAPLLHMSKPEIISIGLECGVDFSMTTSCYDPNPAGAPCAHCESCRLRIAAFKKLEMDDPRLTYFATK